MHFLDFLKNISAEVYVFVISMLPVVELRFAIPIGHIMDLNPVVCYFLSVLGNMLPVPFMLLFIKEILKFMSRSKIKLLNKLSNKLLDKAAHRTEKVNKYSLWGLFLFVAVPLPGTGAWTGALIASVTGMRFKKSFFSILGGVLVAGIIMTIASYTAVSFLEFLIPKNS